MNVSTALNSSEFSSSDAVTLRSHTENGDVPMPCPFVPINAKSDLNPSGVKI